MSKQRSVKTLIITDDEEAEDLNPFSFKEFLRWKNQDQDQEDDPDKDEDPDQDQDQEQIFRKRLFGKVTFDPGVSSCFFPEYLLSPQEDEWGRSLQSGVDSMSSLCTEEEEEEETRFSSKPEGGAAGRGGAAAGGGATAEGGAAGGGGAENYEGDDETSMAEPASSCSRKSARSSQIQQLKEENMLLRRTIRELQRRSEAEEHRVLELQEELLLRRHQEEKEAEDLESMVHSVEQNLQLMTRRAVRAENSLSRLKVEVQQLQVEAESLRSENDSLKAAESQVVMTMRQNAQVASEYLNKTASHAHSSIRQLLGEAETLLLVSQLLQSIDKISSVNTES